MKILASRSRARVTHIVPALFGMDDGLVGGAERYAFELARHMARRVPTSLVAFGRRDREWMEDALRIRVLSPSWFVRGQRSNPIGPDLLSEIRRANVVHCYQQHIVASSLSAVAARMLGRRVFVTDLGGGGWDISGYLSTDRWYHGHLHISQYSRTVSGQDSNPRAHVILGGVDTVKFSPDPSVERKAVVLYVGRLLPHKGIDILIEAVGPDLPLVIVGREGDEGYVETLHRLARGKLVTFRRDCTDEQLVLAYRQARCVVLPSVYRSRYGQATRVPELLGQTLLEGMACGTPAICTEVASLPEVVENGVTGFVVPPNDPDVLRRSLLQLVREPQEAARMGEAARQSVLRKFDWKRVAARCLEIYGIVGDAHRESGIERPFKLDGSTATSDRPGSTVTGAHIRHGESTTLESPIFGPGSPGHVG